MTSKHGNPWLERDDLGEVTVVRLKIPEVLDQDTIGTIFDTISSLSGVGRNQLVLNLAAVEYLPSVALGKLVMLNHKVQAASGRLALCQLNPSVHQSLESTHLTELFNTYATEQEAVRSFS